MSSTAWAEREVILNRLFDAPRRLVFEAWTRPEHLTRWFTPKGCSVPFCELDFRPGGVWHYCMRLPDGSEDWIRSVYREIVEPERIVLTSTFVDEEGSLVLRPDRPREILTVATFAEQDGKPMVTDGPFSEAKEVLGGYWMIQVKSKEQAIEWAKRCPGSDNEVVEVRQVQELSDFPADVQQAAAGFSEMQSPSEPTT